MTVACVCFIVCLISATMMFSFLDAGKRVFAAIMACFAVPSLIVGFCSVVGLFLASLVDFFKGK